MTTAGSTSFDVCVVGSANLDLVATAARLPLPGETVHGTGFAEHPGGKGLNQAVSAARCGASVAFVGAVGGDAAGDALSSVLVAEGIATGFLASVPQPTGRALIGVSTERGENSIIVVAGANALVVADEMPQARVVLTQLEVPLATVRTALQLGRERGAMTMLNPAPATELPADLLSLCDVVVPNEHEVELLGGVDHLLGLGVGNVVVTLGARGAAWHTATTDRPIAPFAVTPVDTTGAGDAFCGALAGRLAAGVGMADALVVASAAGALATTRLGAVPSMATLSEVQALVAAGR
jgi:ribokinase